MLMLPLLFLDLQMLRVCLYFWWCCFCWYCWRCWRCLSYWLGQLFLLVFVVMPCTQTCETSVSRWAGNVRRCCLSVCVDEVNRLFLYLCDGLLLGCHLELQLLCLFGVVFWWWRVFARPYVDEALLDVVHAFLWLRWLGLQRNQSYYAGLCFVLLVALIQVVSCLSTHSILSKQDRALWVFLWLGRWFVGHVICC